MAVLLKNCFQVLSVPTPHPSMQTSQPPPLPFHPHTFSPFAVVWEAVPASVSCLFLSAVVTPSPAVATGGHRGLYGTSGMFLPTASFCDITVGSVARLLSGDVACFCFAEARLGGLGSAQEGPLPSALAACGSQGGSLQGPKVLGFSLAAAGTS